MNFEVRTHDGAVDVYADSFIFDEAHYGLWVRAEVRHELHVEVWGDVTVYRHIHRVFHGLVDKETEGREIAKQYPVEDAAGAQATSITFRLDEKPEAMQLAAGSRRAWHKLHYRPTDQREDIDQM